MRPRRPKTPSYHMLQLLSKLTPTSTFALRIERRRDPGSPLAKSISHQRTLLCIPVILSAHTRDELPARVSYLPYKQSSSDANRILAPSARYPSRASCSPCISSCTDSYGSPRTTRSHPFRQTASSHRRDHRTVRRRSAQHATPRRKRQ